MREGFGVELAPSVIPAKYKARACHEAIEAGQERGIYHSARGAWCIRPIGYQFHTLGDVWLLAAVVYPLTEVR